MTALRTNLDSAIEKIDKMNKPGKKKAHLIKEDIKDRHTSHWDLDYISQAELEQLMARKPDQSVDNSSSTASDSTDNESEKE